MKVLDQIQNHHSHACVEQHYKMISSISFLTLTLLLAATTTFAIDAWNTPGTTVRPIVKCPGNYFEMEIDVNNEESEMVGSKTTGIRLESTIPLRKSDYVRLIEEARKIANQADEEDNSALEEKMRSEIRRLKKLRKKTEENKEMYAAAMNEPTVYLHEALKWSVLKTWSLELLAEKYSDILIQRSSSITLENGGSKWNDVELSEYLKTTFRQQKMEVTDYEEKLLAKSAPIINDASNAATTDPEKFLAAVEQTALDIFVDYDTWEMKETPEGEYAEGRLRQIQSSLLKDLNFRNSWLYKTAKQKEPPSTFTIGPPGSGQTFNQTQGRWIAVIQGSLRVFLYPHSTLPPNSFPQKASIAEWIEHIYQTPTSAAAEWNEPLEVTLKPGNVMHIPSGYHMASLACSEVLYLTIWDQETNTPIQIVGNVQEKLQNVAAEIREEKKEQGEEELKKNNAEGKGRPDGAIGLEDLSEEQDDLLKDAAEEGVARLMKILKRNPRRPDILLAAATFQMLNYNHAEALTLVNKAKDIVPLHTAPYLAIMRIRSNELQYLLDEVDMKDEDDFNQNREAGDSNPSEEQLSDMLLCAVEIASSIKTLIQIDQTIRWSQTLDFVSSYNGLAMLESAIGSKTVRTTIGAAEYVSADSTDPYTLELYALEGRS